MAAKDIILALIAQNGVGGGTGHVFEYTGPAIRALGMEARMTICNISIEGGARAGMVAPDDTTFEWVIGRPGAPGDVPEEWLELRTDPGATFDREITVNADAISPMVTWGTTPGMVVPVTEAVPTPISDQDELSPFSSLNAIRAMAAAGWQRALVLVMDQSTLPYVTRPVPTLGADPADHAVGLVFSMDSRRPGRPLAALWQRRDVPPSGIRQAVAEAAATLPAVSRATPVTVLAGCHIGADDLPPQLWGPGSDGGPLVPAPTGASCVAAWAGLAGLPASAQSGRVIVTEYAPALGGLGVAVFDPDQTNRWGSGAYPGVSRHA